MLQAERLFSKSAISICAVHIITRVITWKHQPNLQWWLPPFLWITALYHTFIVQIACTQHLLKLCENVHSRTRKCWELTRRVDQHRWNKRTEKFPVPAVSSGKLWFSSRRQTPADQVHQTWRCDAFSLLASSSHSSVVSPVSQHVHPWNHKTAHTLTQLTLQYCFSHFTVFLDVGGRPEWSGSCYTLWCYNIKLPVKGIALYSK